MREGEWWWDPSAESRGAATVEVRNMSSSMAASQEHRDMGREMLEKKALLFQNMLRGSLSRKRKYQKTKSQKSRGWLFSCPVILGSY